MSDLDLLARADALRKDADEATREGDELRASALRLRKAADVLDPPKPKPKPKAKRRASKRKQQTSANGSQPGWDADEAARMRRVGKTWDQVEEQFKTGVTSQALVVRLSKAGYGSKGERLPLRPNGNGATLALGTAGHTSHEDDPDAGALRESLVHTSAEEVVAS